MAKRYKEMRFASREEWLAAREDGIGSSEVGAILGIHPFQSAFKVWKRKVGLEEVMQDENEQMAKGHIYEPYAAEVFEKDNGMQIIRSSEGDWIAVDKERPYLRVSVDRTCWLKDAKHNESGKGIVECKTSDKKIESEDLYPYMDESGDIKTGKVQYWWYQVLYQQYVLGYETAYLQFVNRLHPITFKWTEEISYDKDLFEQHILPALDDFWNNKVLPAREALNRGADVDWVVEEYAPAVETVEDAKERFPKAEEGSHLEADEETMGYIALLKETTEQRKDLEKKEEFLKGWVMSKMGSMETMVYQGSVVCTNKNAKSTVKFDSKRYAEEHPEEVKEYMVETPGSRRFLVK